MALVTTKEMFKKAYDGGYAVGAATDEKTGDGIDEKKRARLISAGADMVIPNFENRDAILKKLKII